MNINFRVIFHVLGLLLGFNALFMALCIPASFYFNFDDVVPMGFSTTATGGLGMMLWALTRSNDKPNIRKREGLCQFAPTSV